MLSAGHTQHDVGIGQDGFGGAYEKKWSSGCRISGPVGLVAFIS